MASTANTLFAQTERGRGLQSINRGRSGDHFGDFGWWDVVKKLGDVVGGAHGAVLEQSSRFLLYAALAAWVSSRCSCRFSRRASSASTCFCRSDPISAKRFFVYALEGPARPGDRPDPGRRVCRRDVWKTATEGT